MPIPHYSSANSILSPFLFTKFGSARIHARVCPTTGIVPLTYHPTVDPEISLHSLSILPLRYLLPYSRRRRPSTPHTRFRNHPILHVICCPSPRRIDITNCQLGKPILGVHRLELDLRFPIGNQQSTMEFLAWLIAFLSFLAAPASTVN